MEHFLACCSHNLLESLNILGIMDIVEKTTFYDKLV